MLSKNLRAAVERLGIVAEKYPTIPTLRAAVRRAERLHDRSKEVQERSGVVAGHPTGTAPTLSNPLEGASHQAAREGEGKGAAQAGDVSLPIPVRLLVVAPNEAKAEDCQ